MTKKQSDMIREINENEDANLTAWEIDFMETVTGVDEDEGKLSVKQAEILETIWNKVFN